MVKLIFLALGIFLLHAAYAQERATYYYHIPTLRGINFPMIRFLQEAERKIPNLAGIKYTDENLMDFNSCLNYQNKKYDLLWGRDEILSDPSRFFEFCSHSKKVMNY